jgi:hypothetical protein
LNNIIDPVTIEGVEYVYDEMSPEVQGLVQHMTAIDGQLNAVAGQMELLQMARETCFSRLLAGLAEKN